MSLPDLNHTIFALASGALPSGVAVWKISGKRAFDFISKHTSPILPKKRGMFYRTLIDEKGCSVDDALILTFLSPHSHTGEDIVEIHSHGSIAVCDRIRELLIHFGLRPAEKGEFSYRAFLNSKLELSQLDELADIFLAREQADLDLIYSRKDDLFNAQIDRIRDSLLRIQSIIETAIDFSEEYSQVLSLSRPIIQEAIRDCSAITQRFSQLRSGTSLGRIVLAGSTNAGKSSLFNALLLRYRSIVQDSPGTTRDAIEDDLEVSGRKWKLVDTAGVRITSNSVELSGIEIGKQFLDACSYWVHVIDGTKGPSKADEELLELFGSKAHCVIWNKKDLASWALPIGFWKDKNPVLISLVTGEGLEHFLERLAGDLSGIQVGNLQILPREHQYSRLLGTITRLQDMEEAFHKEIAPEILAEMNKSAIQCLENVMGSVTTEEVLGRVFSEFCIGK